MGWLVLAAVLISAGNAIMRKAFDIARKLTSKFSGTCSQLCSCRARTMCS